MHRFCFSGNDDVGQKQGGMEASLNDDMTAYRDVSIIIPKNGEFPCEKEKDHLAKM